MPRICFKNLQLLNLWWSFLFLSFCFLPSLSGFHFSEPPKSSSLTGHHQHHILLASDSEIPRKRLEEKAKALANQGEWTSFIDILALLVFGTILFPNVDGPVDLAAINAFLAYHHSKESPVIAILADAYDTFDLRCEKSSARILCCTPALYVWLVSHVFLSWR